MKNENDEGEVSKNANNRKIETGGAAFPLNYGQDEHGRPNCEEGMSLRSYFAAHAPEMPVWYKVKAKYEKPAFPEPADAIKNVVKRWKSDGAEGEVFQYLDEVDISDANIQLCNEWQQKNYDHWSVISDYDNQYKMIGFIEWRYAYADAMILAGKGGKGYV